MPTKEELQALVDQQAAIIRDLQEQLASRDAVNRASGEPGWLFICKNPNYSGTVYGVRFSDGRAFLPKGKPGAERTMRRIISDFGYECREINAKDFDNLPANPRQADPERAFLEKVAPAQVIA